MTSAAVNIIFYGEKTESQIEKILLKLSEVDDVFVADVEVIDE